MKMTEKIKFISAVILWVTFLSCRKDYPIGPVNLNPDQKPDTTNTADSGATKRVFIVNEGNYQWGNASVSVYYPMNKTVSNDAFKSQNGYPLGDVAQSMTVYKDRGFIMVDNSGKIEVVRQDNLTSLESISGITSPRYMAVISDTKAYVSSIYGDKVFVINPQMAEKTGEITLPGWTEQMAISGDKVFVTNVDSDKVYVIDPQNDQVIGSVKVGKGPNSIVADLNGKLWVLCSGGYQEKNAALIRLNPQSFLPEQTFTFPDISMSPGELTLNPGKDTLFFLNKGVYRMSVYENALPSSAFVSGEGKLFYGLGVDPVSGDVYVSDAVDYVQAGKVYRYRSRDGAEIDRFEVGIIPGAFAFH